VKVTKKREKIKIINGMGWDGLFNILTGVWARPVFVNLRETAAR
jgi:hypothetical protein